MDRRHCTDQDLARLPDLAGFIPNDWAFTGWGLGPSYEGDGHHDDAIAVLTPKGGGLDVLVPLCSFDFDGRNDDQLRDWCKIKAREEIATAIRRVNMKTPDQAAVETAPSAATLETAATASANVATREQIAPRTIKARV